MKKTKVFIDGEQGTTGLKIYERFENRDDIELLHIEEHLRKDESERKKLINASDITFLCLPDDAARTAVSLVENPNTKIIDASTTHRTNPAWTYGFAELSKTHRANIQNTKRLAVPGCYASGFIALVYPLIANGFLDNNTLISSYGISGYSGGGKTMIEEYESKKTQAMYSPRMYATKLNHKHLPEMQVISGLANKPLFTPIVDDYYNGMLVCVPLFTHTLRRSKSAKDVWEMFATHYQDEYFLQVMDFDEDYNFLSANDLANTNKMQLFILGNDEQISLVACLDKLGKGASANAIQNMNIMLGLDETTGLIEERK